ncbi:MAG: ABC transporter ATP-binding protein, partial [Methylococcales bacterium]|nr:ABC transporter ATP-binding protein [Methylococcales bacterium]
MQIIFQDPFASMNPRMLVGEIIAEGLQALYPKTSQAQIDLTIHELLQKVGLPIASALRYPHEFSGGQRQRICIARALALKPKLIICDEPTSALDVSVQAQIITLLKSLQKEHGISYLFITHDLAVVAEIADEIAVMYQGKIVEQGWVKQILENPRHPYSQKLLAAIPRLQTEG